MYDILVVGSGMCGLNVCDLLKDTNKICLIEKSNKIGGHVQTKYYNFDNDGNKTSVKFEAGGAVVYDYQKDMMKLIKKHNINTTSIPVNPKKHMKKFYDCINNPDYKVQKINNIGERNTEKFHKLIKKVFSYMDKHSNNYCRKFTFEQMCAQVLNSKDIRFFEYCYGYSGEFKITNALVAKLNLTNELFKTNNVILFNDGYSSLINKIHDSIKESVDVKLNCELERFVSKEKYINVYIKGQKKPIVCKNIVLAIPKEALLKLNTSFDYEELDLFESVSGNSLCRLFAQYDVSKKNNSWMKNLQFGTLENPVKQIIPTNNDLGIFQISYTDWFYADYWGKMKKDECLITLKKFLGETFCDKKIDDPIWFKKFYWPNAIHFWMPHINEKKMYKRIMSLRNNVFIGGESYSLIQGWNAGALQTAIDISKLLK